MDEIKLKDRAVSVLDKALGLQAGHAHRLQLQTQAAEQQMAAMRDAQRVGPNAASSAANSPAPAVSPPHPPLSSVLRPELLPLAVLVHVLSNPLYSSCLVFPPQN